MKKSIQILVLVLSFVVTSFAQKNIPTLVKQSFSNLYPEVKTFQWDKENGDYEASFKVNKIAHSVLFDDKGNVLETEVEIKLIDLPLGVTDYISKQYQNQKVKGVARIDSKKDGLIFEVEMKEKDILFDSKGNFIKEVKD